MAALFFASLSSYLAYIEIEETQPCNEMDYYPALKIKTVIE
jgi:hypothetical protein